MATTSTPPRDVPSAGRDAPPQFDLRRTLSALIPLLVGLLLAEFVFERIREVGRRFGRRHPLLATLARGPR